MCIEGQPHIRGHRHRVQTVTKPIQLNWVGATETRETILAQSDQRINALKAKAKGQGFTVTATRAGNSNNLHVITQSVATYLDNRHSELVSRIQRVYCHVHRKETHFPVQ